MFDAVLFMRPEVVDVGLLAEAMLFYQRTTLIVDGPRLEQLLDAIDPSIIVDLLDAGHLKLRFVDGVVGALGTVPPYDLLTVRAQEPGEAGDPRVTLHAVLDDVVRKKLGRRGPAGVRIVNKFLRQVPAENLAGPFLESARAELEQGAYVGPAVRAMIARRDPDAPRGRIFVVKRTAAGLDVETDIDFSRVAGPDSSLSIPRVLATFANAHQHLHFAARERSELAVEEGDTMVVLRAKVRTLVAAREKSSAQAADFQDLLLESHAVGEAINSGRRTFAEFVHLLDVARPFKKWLADISPNTRVAGEYLRAVEAKTWLGSEPGKVFRWAALSVAGVVAGLYGDPGIAGAALSALDAAYAEKLGSGWRPNQFVTGPMRSFVFP